MKKLESIDALLNRAMKLSKDPKKNALELAKLRKQIILQKEIIDKIDTNKISQKINTLDNSECKRYKDILYEKKRYNEKRAIINRIIKEDYSVLNAHRKIKNAKLCGALISSALVISLISCTINNVKNKNKSNDSNNISTEFVTEEEYTTEIIYTEQEDQDIETNGKENIFEDFEDNENTIEKITTTENNNLEEKTTEATTEEYIVNSNTESNRKITEKNEENTTTQSTTENNNSSTEKKEENTTEATTEYNNSNAENWGFDNLNTSNMKNGIDYFNKASKYIDNMEEAIIDPNKREEAKGKAKEKAISYIDFIFYGKDINGVYFNDLKSDAKDKAYKNCQKLVQLVNKYDPEYFDNMGERYSRFKDLASMTLDSAKEKVKEKVGEDYYNDAGEVKDDTIDTIKDTGKILKNVISDKYNEWKNKGN